MKLQIVLDCGEPHALVEFWAAALGYEVENHSALVDQLLAAGHLPPDAAVTTRFGRGFADLAACRNPSGSTPRLLLQRVPEPAQGKLRQHLDLQVGPEAAGAEVARLQTLGATVAWVSDDRGGRCTTMRDPEGNEFCVS
jgi:hypothetical protein